MKFALILTASVLFLLIIGSQQDVNDMKSPKIKNSLTKTQKDYYDTEMKRIDSTNKYWSDKLKQSEERLKRTQQSLKY